MAQKHTILVGTLTLHIHISNPWNRDSSRPRGGGGELHTATTKRGPTCTTSLPQYGCAGSGPAKFAGTAAPGLKLRRYGVCKANAVRRLGPAANTTPTRETAALRLHPTRRQGNFTGPAVSDLKLRRLGSAELTQRRNSKRPRCGYTPPDPRQLYR